jgi:ankyrin repeat protein
MGSGSSRNNIISHYNFGLGNEDSIIEALRNNPDKSHYKMIFANKMFAGSDRTTLLSFSVYREYYRVVEHMVHSNENIEINYIGQSGLTALDIACIHRNYNCVNLLIGAGAIDHAPDNPLIYYFENYSLLDRLICRGHNVNMVTRHDTKPWSNALSVAIKKENFVLVKKLSECGADPNCILLNHRVWHSFFEYKKREVTLIELAIITKNKKIIKYILNNNKKVIDEGQIMNIIKSSQVTKNEEIIRMVIYSHYKFYCRYIHELFINGLMNDRGFPKNIISNIMMTHDGCVVNNKLFKYDCCKRTIVIIIATMKKNNMVYDTYENILQYLK